MLESFLYFLRARDNVEIVAVRAINDNDVTSGIIERLRAISCKGPACRGDSDSCLLNFLHHRDLLLD